MRVRVVLEGRWKICSPVRGERTELEVFLEKVGANLERDRHQMLSIIDEAAREGPDSVVGGRAKLLKGLAKGKLSEFKAGRLRVFWFVDPDNERFVICTGGIVKSDKQEQDRAVRKALGIRERCLAGYEIEE